MSDAEALDDDVTDVRAFLLDLLSRGEGEQAVEFAVRALEDLKREHARLLARLASELRARFGRRSEKVSQEQLELFLGQLGDTVPVNAQPGAAIPPPKHKPSPARSRGRKPLPADLPREPYDVPVPPEARTCVECGCEKTTIGYVTSEVLEFVPARFVVKVPRREKVACPKCEAHVEVADDDKLAAGMRPGPGLLSELIVGKWQDALPIERQADRFTRLGIDLASSTLLDWSAFGLDLLAPIAQRITKRVLGSPYVQIDDTTLKVLDPKRKPAVKTGHLWAMVGIEPRLTAFFFAPDWSAAHPAEVLVAFGGHLQGDGYAGYQRLMKPQDDDSEPILSPDRMLACGMHIRRRFEAAAKLGDARGAVALGFFRKLYLIEAECKEGGLSADARLERRRLDSRPLLDELYGWIEKLHTTLVPSSKLYDATRYAIANKESWLRCFDDGQFEIDNGEVERQIRRVALGRKNFLFAGSDAGGVRAAVAYTVLASCRMHDVDPTAYVRDVLRKLADGWPQSRIDDLLPDRWTRTAPA